MSASNISGLLSGQSFIWSHTPSIKCATDYPELHIIFLFLGKSVFVCESVGMFVQTGGQPWVLFLGSSTTWFLRHGLSQGLGASLLG